MFETPSLAMVIRASYKSTHLSSKASYSVYSVSTHIISAQFCERGNAGGTPISQIINLSLKLDDFLVTSEDYSF